MIATDTLLNGLPPELTLRFFAVFARLEFAMKYADCLVTTNPGDTAMASRKTLAAKLPASFFETAKAVAPELIAEPPRALVAQGASLPQFDGDAAAVTDTLGLLHAVWQVRNNLFHGNKTAPANRARDVRLMTECLAVIDVILAASDAVAERFEEPQQEF